MKNTPENVIEEAVRKRYPSQETALGKMFESINNLPSEDRDIVLSALGRYEEEARQGSYKTEPGALTRFIVDEKLIEGSDAFVDLGAGAGDFLFELAQRYPQIDMRGMDLSPGFVENFSEQARVRNASLGLGLIDTPLNDSPPFMPFIDCNLNPRNNVSVASVLTLDRLTNPRVLIENMARFTRAKILGTLLPIVPEDDNPSRQGEEKIVYTREPNRIVPGKTVVEDRDALLRVLRDVWKKPVDVENVPYEVTSSGDTQNYDLAVFYSR